MNKRWQIAAVAAALFAGAASAQAQDIRMYVFSSGALTIGKGVLQNFGPMDPPIQVPVGFYLVKHPKGNVLFDTGNNDNLIKDINWWPKGLQGLKPGEHARRGDRCAARQDRRDPG